MKRKLIITLTLLLTVAMLAIGCGGSDPTDNKTYVAIHRAAPLDARFERFYMLQLNGDSSLFLANERGVTAIYFTPTPDESNKKLVCTIDSIYVNGVTTPSESLRGSIGHITDANILRECFGEQTTFTLYVNSDGVVTSDDLPTLLPDVIVS